MRGLVIEFTASVIGSPVASSAWTICAAGTSGSFERRSAMAPATYGAAAEVPSAVAQPLPGTDEVTETPGASRATIGPSSVNGASASGVVVVEAPTATALLMQAGAPTPMWLGFLPAATTVGIPSAARASIAGLRRSESQLER